VTAKYAKKARNILSNSWGKARNNADAMDTKFSTLLQSSFSSDPAEIEKANIIPTPNGFVLSVVRAYGQHHDLVIRPDDVWIAILTQFSF